VTNDKPIRTNVERREWVIKDAGLYEWWTRTCLPMEKFVQDNRVQIDECIDREQNRPKPTRPKRL